MKRQVEIELKRTSFDVVHVHLIRMAQYSLRNNPEIPRILDLTDAGSVYLQRFLDTTRSPLQRLFLSEEVSRIKKYESVLEHFDKCLVCSDPDRQALLKNAPNARIDLLYNGVDLEYFTSNGVRSFDRSRIIFTGNMSYYPNRDGVAYFVKEIFPLIKRQDNDVKLFIVGKDPPPSIRHLSRDDITVTGFVPEIKEYYLQSAVAVAPVRFGAGTLNKVLEPMALGVPVVASPSSVEGLPVQHFRDLLIADSPIEFANCVVELLRDRNLQGRLSENSKAIVRKLYDWKMVARQLESSYSDLHSNRLSP